jgi:peptidoglycan/LPS O-acetylase OafA/YrhL
MTASGPPLTDERFLVSGDEAGTAPIDRRFRPDVEGLRAVAVLLVVFYHANVPRLTGGYVGVDVFFVISGFVITGVLLRERSSTGGNSMLGFYARRVRRIFPAATAVILTTVFCCYVLLGFVSGNNVADDGRWAAVFLSNFHFAAIGTNYLSAARPPSPLQNYWTLSVEEQFYVVFPTIFLLVAGIRSRGSLRVRMSVVLGIIIVGSYSLSIVQTASNPTAAYFSPFTRAWELGLGALVAVATSWLKGVPQIMAWVMSWAGLFAIVGAAFIFGPQTAYPGSLVAIPVVGAAMIIAGGVALRGSGAELLLGRRPLQWFGARSYSLYLWHWPILIIAAERVGKSSLPVGQNLLLILLAVALSAISYAFIENPIRHWGLPSKQTMGAGIALVVATVLFLSLLITIGSREHGVYRITPAADNEVVLREVASAVHISLVPASIEPALSDAAYDYGGYDESTLCQGDFTNSSEKVCMFGDPHGRQLMVLYGDSHAMMWAQPVKLIAKRAGWRLAILGKPACPASMVVVANTLGNGAAGAPYRSCELWHEWAMKEINRLHPTLVVISQTNGYVTPRTSQSPSRSFTPSEWREGLTRLFSGIAGSTRKVLLGDIPVLPQSGPTCLSGHPNDAQACSAPLAKASHPLDSVDRSTAAALGVQYVDPTPWFCSDVCTAIIGKFDVYLDYTHVTSAYASYLQNALAEALNIPPVH